ncbi:EAL domain-containing protein [Geodermatophilus sp. DSM 45219]|uniref:EAL domain-containing protein n=1 Tax=Geodermatophilus sp. DSM 45219 TaxID=1881103 RepID=UPI00210184B0|nr:EAL domain-containing protein [Geodermatophilus sp. DSM 45219]
MSLPARGDVTASDWDDRLAAVFADPSLLRLVFQPIVDLQRGAIAGYETLARFSTPDGRRSEHPPDLWFAAADAVGRGAELEAVVVREALAVLPTLPPDCFLTVNVSPHLLTQPELSEPLLAVDDLAPLVLELTEHQAVGDLRPLVDLRDRLRARGALLALDDAGSGYSGLQQITQFRPQLIKLDRALVCGVDGDEVKLALVEMLGEFGGRIDAWLLAEGIETWGELQAFQRLRVPLGQGWLLGRPGPPWAQLDPAVRDRLRHQAAQALLTDHVAGLAEPVLVVRDGETPPGALGVEVDEFGHPRWLLVPHRRGDDPPGHRRAPVSLRVPASAGLSEVAHRVAARPEETRFDPVVCVDAHGAALGIVRVERLLLQLAAARAG